MVILRRKGWGCVGRCVYSRLGFAGALCEAVGYRNVAPGMVSETGEIVLVCGSGVRTKRSCTIYNSCVINGRRSGNTREREGHRGYRQCGTRGYDALRVRLDGAEGPGRRQRRERFVFKRGHGCLCTALDSNR